MLTGEWLDGTNLLGMCVSHSVVSDSLRPHGLQPTRLLCPWGFSRQEYSSGLPHSLPGGLPNPGVKARSPTLQAHSSPPEPPGEPKDLIRREGREQSSLTAGSAVLLRLQTAVWVQRPCTGRPATLNWDVRTWTPSWSIWPRCFTLRTLVWSAGFKVSACSLYQQVKLEVQRGKKARF